MTTEMGLQMSQMASRVDVDIRQRIAANLRYLRYFHEFKTVAAMASKMGMSRSALNRYLKGERTVGLDVLLLAKAAFGASLDWFVTNRPPDRFFKPDSGEP